MVGGGSDANTSDTSHKRRCLCCWTYFFFFSESTLNVWVFHDWAQDNGGRRHSGREGLLLFVQDNTQQQHTEMLRGAIDSTDERISEIPRGYKCISNPNRERPVCGKKTN